MVSGKRQETAGVTCQDAHDYETRAHDNDDEVPVVSTKAMRPHTLHVWFPRAHAHAQAEKLAFLQSLVVNSNYYIYERQLNIVLTIKETLFAPANSQPSWDDRNCNKVCRAVLANMTK